MFFFRFLPCGRVILWSSILSWSETETPLSVSAGLGGKEAEIQRKGNIIK